MKPTIRQLEYLVAVADEGGFQRAADACGVSQPGLSAQIRELERILEVRLFERRGRRSLPTAAGEALLPRARAVLETTDDLLGAARGFGEPLTGTLRLGVIPTVAPYLLPQALPAVRRHHPHLRLLLREDPTARLVDQLERGELDVLLLALEAPLGDCVVQPLLRDPFWLAVRSDHRLARRRRVRESDLADEPVLLLDDGHCLRDQALAVCGRAGASELGDFRASSLPTLVQMVANGVGVTLLPELAGPCPDPVVLRPFVRPAPQRTIGLAWRRTSPRADEFRLLGARLRSAAPARPALRV